MVFSTDALPYALCTALQNLSPLAIATHYRNCRQNKYDYFITSLQGDQVAEELVSLAKDKTFSMRGVIADIPDEVFFPQGKEKQVKKSIKQQIKYAYHLGLKGVVLTMPKEGVHR